MAIHCPNCGQVVNIKKLHCGNLQCLPPKHGVLRLMKNDFYNQFRLYEEQFQKLREAEGVRIKDESVYEQLPFLDNVLGKNIGEWKAFREDLVVINKHLPNIKNLKVLNYGSWNGWLSNQLVNAGCELTAVGYFIDPYDGLGAQQFYKNNWLSIQMEIEDDVDILPNDYDVIIVNRGISFLANPSQSIRHLTQKLAVNGRLIITGLNYYKNSKIPEANFQNYRKYYQDKYQTDLLFKPIKGYLNADDIQKLKDTNIQLIPYPMKRLQNIRATLISSKPAYFYGYYENTK